MARRETALLRRNPTPQFPPIFVIGPPRSGTTLIYQALVRRFALSYFCNIAARFRQSPAVVTRLVSSVRLIEPPPQFESYYGETRNWHGPNQGQGIWARWFGDVQAYTGKNGVSGTALREMSGTVALVERSFGVPFVNKSIGHAVRLQALNAAFPDAIYLRVERNPLDVARSILRGREEYFGDRKHWFSVRPKEYDQIKDHSPIDQICEQIYYIHQNIDSDAAAIGLERFCTVRYEDFCNESNVALADFASHYHDSTGRALVGRRGTPSHFSASSQPLSDLRDEAQLSERISELWRSTSSGNASKDVAMSSPSPDKTT
ncbi:sulfotransferase [Pirellulales bacterium]|nr:sulfotransferase [Pirellulales bacterium]